MAGPQPFVYDNIAEHWREWPADRPRIAAATYAGLYVCWALLSGLGSGKCRGAILRLESLANREVTPGTFYLETLGGSFDDTVLNAEGNVFTTLYFHSDFRTYSDDYIKVGGKRRFFFDVPDTWDRLDALCPLADRHYRMWRECSGPLEARVRQFTGMTGPGPGPEDDASVVKAWKYNQGELARLVEQLRARRFE